MGVLTDFFAATPQELEDLAIDWGSGLARTATETGRDLYLWVSL